MKKSVFLLLLFSFASCTNSAYVKNLNKIPEDLSKGKAVVVFGFSQGDQVLDAAHIRFKLSKDVSGEKLKAQDVSGFFNPDIITIKPGNIYDNWSLLEKHRTASDAKIGKTDFYYPRYGFFEVDPGEYSFNIKSVYRAKTINENTGKFIAKQGEAVYIGTFYFTDQLKYGEDSKTLPTFGFPIEENRRITKERSMNFAALDTYNHFLGLYNTNQFLTAKRIAKGDFYQNKKFIDKYPLN